MKVFVYGWYDKHNLGDEAFKLSFKQLWPQFDFTFKNSIPSNINETYDCLWLGGGSFLEQNIRGLDLVKLPIAFIGVGSATNPALTTVTALKEAKVIAFRDNTAASLWPQAHIMPDLVFGREDLAPLSIPKKKQITVFLNDFISPYGSNATKNKEDFYHTFIKEFAIILDKLSVVYHIKFFPMCINPRIDDRKVAAAIIGRSDYPHRYEWVTDEQTEMNLRQAIQESEFTIAHRFHGIVYSLIHQTPCLTITSHDKFLSLCTELNLPYVNYYDFSKDKFEKEMGKLANFPTQESLLYHKNGIQKWKDFAEMVGKKFQ